MALKPFIAEKGLMTQLLGSAAALAMAAPLVDGSRDAACLTDASRIGFYWDRTSAAEKIGFVVMGTETFSITTNGITLPVGAGAGKVLTSDVDGNATWEDASSGIPEAPSDGTPYGRQDAGWVNVLGADPGDEDVYYCRQNSTWTAFLPGITNLAGAITGGVITISAALTADQTVSFTALPSGTGTAVVINGFEPGTPPVSGVVTWYDGDGTFRVDPSIGGLNYIGFVNFTFSEGDGLIWYEGDRFYFRDGSSGAAQQFFYDAPIDGSVYCRKDGAWYAFAEAQYPGGDTGSLQYNSGGGFDGSPNLLWDATYNSLSIFNVFFGIGIHGTISEDNLLIGEGCNLFGTNNLGIGRWVLQVSDLSGDSNHVIGVHAGNSMSTCSDNTVFGAFGAAGLSTGSENTVIGADTVFTIGTTSKCTLLGYGTSAGDFTESTALGHGSVIDRDYQIRLGSATTVTVNLTDGCYFYLRGREDVDGSVRIFSDASNVSKLESRTSGTWAHLEWDGSGGGGIGGTIAANQVAYGSGTDEIQGSADFTYDGTTLTVPATAFPASTISKASLNIAAGVDPTTPVEGDVWFEGTANAIRFYDGAAKVQVSAQVQKRTVRLRGQVMASVVSGAQSINIASQVTGTIVGWRIITDVATTASLDVWKRNGANPTVAHTIVASAPPTITAATYAASTTLTGWTTAVAVGDVFELNVGSNSAAKVITLELDITVD